VRKAGPAEPSGRKLSTSAKTSIRPCCRWMCAASGTSATGGSVPALASRWPKRPASAAAAAADWTPPAPLPSGFAKSACTFAWLPDWSTDHRVHASAIHRNARILPPDSAGGLKPSKSIIRRGIVQKLGGTNLSKPSHYTHELTRNQQKTKEQRNKTKKKKTRQKKKFQSAMIRLPLLSGDFFQRINAPNRPAKHSIRPRPTVHGDRLTATTATCSLWPCATPHVRATPVPQLPKLGRSHPLRQHHPPTTRHHPFTSIQPK
jgi:hypothetical protein